MSDNTCSRSATRTTTAKKNGLFQWQGSWLIRTLFVLFISIQQFPRIQAISFPSPPQRYSNLPVVWGRGRHRRTASSTTTRAVLDAALLQTRGGGRRPKKTPSAVVVDEKTSDTDVTETTTTANAAVNNNNNNTNSNTAGEGDVKVAVSHEDAVLSEDEEAAVPLQQSSPEAESEEAAAAAAAAAQEEADSPASITQESLLFETQSDDSSDVDASSSSSPDKSTLTELLDRAAVLRKRGKVSHDEGKFAKAAMLFHKAASLLEVCLEKQQQAESGVGVDDTNTNNNDNNDEEENQEEEDDNNNTEVSYFQLQEEWATCRLHESLCHLKAQDYAQCIEACTSLIDSEAVPAAMIRARAYHRRAKALVALDDTDGALEDARSAAFLGDRKAVVFYGKLLRETGGSSSSGIGDSLMPSSSSGFVPPLPEAASSSLLESLLKKSPPSKYNDNTPNDFFTSSLLSSLTGGPGMSPGGFAGANGGGNGGGAASLAKSLMISLSKKLEDESTHDGICRYLQRTNPMQVQSMASMAGIDLSSSQASKLVSIAHGITPRAIRKTVKTTKRAIWGIQLIRKTMALLTKYRHLIFFLMLLQWTKSAVLQPIPAPKIKGAALPPKPRLVAKPVGNANNPNANMNNPNANERGNGRANQKPKTPGLLNNLGR